MTPPRIRLSSSSNNSSVKKSRVKNPKTRRRPRSGEIRSIRFPRQRASLLRKSKRDSPKRRKTKSKLKRTRRSSRPKERNKLNSTKSRDARITESSESKSKGRKSKKLLRRDRESLRRSRWPSRKLGEPKRLQRKNTELKLDKRERGSKPRRMSSRLRLAKVLPHLRRRESSPVLDQLRIMLIREPQDISKTTLNRID